MEHLIFTAGEESIVGLGIQIGDTYTKNAATAEILETINRRLSNEDKLLRNYRRALCFSKVLQKDLIPILVNCQDDLNISLSVIRLLVNLTVPVECLYPPEMIATEKVQSTTYELNNTLAKTKEVFRNADTTRAIMELLRVQTEKKKEFSTDEIALVNSCLLLIRNILHIPERLTNKQMGISSTQNQIMWNLFSQNLDKVLLDLIRHKLTAFWCTSIVQLIALVYKDQHVVTLQKRLQNFLESSLSDSSGDNESNTSPQDDNGYCSSPVNTLDPVTTDDTSEGCGSREATQSAEMDELKIDVENAENKSICSLEVVPNLSPSSAPEMIDEDYRDYQPPSIQPIVTKPENNRSKKTESNSSSGIESGISTCESEPPKKKFVTECPGGNLMTVNRFHPISEEFGYEHKQRGSPKVNRDHHEKEESHLAKTVEKGGSGSDSSSTTGIPKKLAGQNGGSTDFGYVTQQNRGGNQESNSTSSNEDDPMGKQHSSKQRTKPVKLRAKKLTTMTPLEKKEKNTQKLLKRSQENRMRSKAMINHVPTDQDISELLKEFTVDFLLTGYASLVRELLRKLTVNTCIAKDKSHFLWLLTYFLKFAQQLEIGMDQLGSVLSFNTLSYITFEGVDLLETLEMATREQKESLSPHMRRMHLVVTALREFIQTVTSYSRIPYLNETDKSHLETLQLQTAYSIEVRQLLLLLLRRYNSQFQSLQYLSDLVVCNHMLLQYLEAITGSPNYNGPVFNMVEHVRQFASTEMMRQYGSLLQGFDQNSPLVNDCIFTMMHHVAGDLESPQALYIPSVLKSFSRIWEQGLQICDDWVDLIEFIIQKFIQSMGSSPHTCAANIVECLDNTEAVDESGFTVTQAAQLFWHFTQVINQSDPIGAIIEIYRQTENINLPRLTVIQALLSHGVITHAQYMHFMYMKSVMSQCKTDHEDSVIAEVGSEHCHSDGGHATDTEDTDQQLQLHQQQQPQQQLQQQQQQQPQQQQQQQQMTRVVDAPPQRELQSEVEVLKDLIVKQGRGSLLLWVQEVLLEVCRVKMFPDSLIPENSCVPHEPIPFYYNKSRQSIPLVPYNRVQFQGLQTESFILLLHKLGFLLPADVGKAFPRIPHFWSADHLYSVAGKIGPINEAKLKFTLKELENRVTSQKMITAAEEVTAIDSEPMEMDDMVANVAGCSGNNSPIAWSNAPGNGGLESLDMLSGPSQPIQQQQAASKSIDWVQMAMMSKSASGSTAQPFSRTIQENSNKRITQNNEMDDTSFMDMF